MKALIIDQILAVTRAILFDKQVLQLKRAWKADKNNTILYQIVHATENPLKVDQYKSMVTSFGLIKLHHLKLKIH